MKINMDELLDSMLEGISNMDYVRSEDIPNIELYMDQVTSFMDEQLSSSKRYDDDKILTKTMINIMQRTTFSHHRLRRSIPKNMWLS